ncbi:MAG: ThuA domain-containing protein, partial [Ktedonobacteraceae bacterium]
MAHLSRWLLIGWLALAFLILSSCGTGNASPVLSQAQPARLLVFSRTAAFRHASIPAAIAALRGLAQEHHVAIDFTEDSTVFTISNLVRYAAVVFLSTTGTVLDTDQANALESYIHAGGGYVGIHSASDTEYN